jgi:uncharacterized spore protein YtfJ
MTMQDMLTGAQDMITVRRVFGEAYERDGVTVIPAATVRGGLGGSFGGSANGQGSGGGFGLVAKPAGALVIKDGRATWQPALDLNRVVLGGQVLGLVALLTLRAVLKRLARKR